MRTDPLSRCGVGLTEPSGLGVNLSEEATVLNFVYPDGRSRAEEAGMQLGQRIVGLRTKYGEELVRTRDDLVRAAAQPSCRQRCVSGLQCPQQTNIAVFSGADAAACKRWGGGADVQAG